MANPPGAEAMDQEEEGYVREGGITIGWLACLFYYWSSTGDIYIPPPPAPACTLDNNGPRLVITHIENENFKSYAGIQVELLIGGIANIFSRLSVPSTKASPA